MPVVHRRMRAGSLTVNSLDPFPAAMSPFGGTEPALAVY
jgi:hypothetical protein